MATQDPWLDAVNPVDRTRHIIPNKDIVPHLLSLGCECNPSRDEEDPNIIVHYAWDGRDLIADVESGE